MDQEFEEWMVEFDKDWKDSKAYNLMVGKGYSQATYQLLSWYMQFKQNKSHEKLVKWTIWLVLGTWALVIATLLLVALNH